MKIPLLFACGMAALVAPAFAQSYSFTVFAGMPPPTGSRDASGTEARFNTPTAVAVDAAGNIYVADRDNSVVRKISSAGAVTTLAGLAGAVGSVDGTGQAARFNQPTGIAVDGSGNVFVTDRADHTIRKITPAGVVTTFAGLSSTPGANDGNGTAARFRGPTGIAIDADGNIYVADTENRTLRKISSAGAVSTFAGAAGIGGNVDGTGSSARFNELAGLAVDAARNIYAVDSGSHVVRKITPAGVVSTVAGLAGTSGVSNGAGTAARFNRPFGIASDPAGTLYIADTQNESIRRITADGTVSLFAGSVLAGNNNAAGANASFFRPRGIAIDASGNVYVADTYNHSIRKLTPQAAATTLAGGGGNFGSADGTGTSALFNHPLGITRDRQGNLFVSDTFNSTIRKISPDAAVTTFAGQAGSIAYQDATGSEARFGAPVGLTTWTDDNLYVVDQYFHALRQITPQGQVRSFAGTPGSPGATDGPYSFGRFNRPYGVVFDRDGNGYVTDSGNHTIRKVLRNSEISTFVGLTGFSGSSDGVGAGARFSGPSAIAIDSAGNLYVTDYNNSTVRKITSAGVVTTLAGKAGTNGWSDGTGAAATFDNADGIAVDASGTVFVSDSNNHVIRKITSSGVVTTIGGSPGLSGVVEGTGSGARFFLPSGILVDPNGVLYVVNAYGNVIMRGALDTVPTIDAQPQSQAVTAGQAATFQVRATGGGLSYQWKLNGAAIPNATSATYTIPAVELSQAGNYTVDISNSAGSRTSSVAALTVASEGPSARISNVSVRTAMANAQTLIVGVVVSGGSRNIVVRAAGPALAGFGLGNAMTDPRLELFNGATSIMTNDDWPSNLADAFASVGAFPFAVGSKDAGFLTGIDGARSIQARGTAAGVVLVEAYDVGTGNSPRLINISARNRVGTGDDILIAGFNIAGTGTKRLLFRAVAARLATAPFNIPGTLADPKLELYNAAGAKIAENDSWSDTLAPTFAQVGAFALDAGSRDAALLTTLTPGTYTVQVRGADGGTGEALVEVYEVP